MSFEKIKKYQKKEKMKKECVRTAIKPAFCKGSEIKIELKKQHQSQTNNDIQKVSIVSHI